MPWWSSRRVVVHDESMLPTLRAGDRLIVDRRAYRRGTPRTGEIVVLADPDAPERWLVKRIAAVGPATDPEVVPAGAVFVLSDAPGTGRDSRRFGPVPVDRLLGRAVRRYYPADRRSEL